MTVFCYISINKYKCSDLVFDFSKIILNTNLFQLAIIKKL